MVDSKFQSVVSSRKLVGRSPDLTQTLAWTGTTFSEANQRTPTLLLVVSTSAQLHLETMKTKRTFSDDPLIHALQVTQTL